MTKEQAIGIAARIWCEPKHENKEMDAAFAESIAAQILSAHLQGLEDGKTHDPELYHDYMMKKDG